MVLEMVKYVRVKLEQLLGHVVHGDLAYLAHQLHLKKVQKHRHTGLNVEEGAQNLKGPYHGPTIGMELGRGHVQVLNQGTLECVQGET